MKREPTIWENVFAHDISNKGFISKYIKNSHDPTSETQPNYKMGKGPEQTILQGGHAEGPETYERMSSLWTMLLPFRGKITIKLQSWG